MINTSFCSKARRSIGHETGNGRGGENRRTGRAAVMLSAAIAAPWAAPARSAQIAPAPPPPGRAERTRRRSPHSD